MAGRLWIDWGLTSGPEEWTSWGLSSDVPVTLPGILHVSGGSRVLATTGGDQLLSVSGGERLAYAVGDALLHTVASARVQFRVEGE